MSQSLVVAAVDRLTPDERAAYERHVQANKPCLAPSFNRRLYELYLRGLSCEAIALLQTGLDLGDVCRARIDGQWDSHRDSYTAELLTETNGLLRQTAAESLQFLSLMLSVAHKQYGDKLKRYLASGDPADLGTFQVQNLKQYQAVIETIAKLIGADQKKTVTHRVENSDGSPTPAGGIVGSIGTGRFTPTQADAMRAALEKSEK